MNNPNKYWLSYDLGFGGDYEGLYNWLDTVGAIECGNSVAFFEKEYPGNALKAIAAEINEYVRVDKSTRIYIIFRKRSGEVSGKFLIGRRKRAPWWGYSPTGLESFED